eukprot:6772908-Alexandrium_andersonii.AAC.1
MGPQSSRRVRSAPFRAQSPNLPTKEGLGGSGAANSRNRRLLSATRRSAIRAILCYWHARGQNK